MGSVIRNDSGHSIGVTPILLPGLLSLFIPGDAEISAYRVESHHLSVWSPRTGLQVCSPSAQSV